MAKGKITNAATTKSQIASVFGRMATDNSGNTGSGNGAKPAPSTAKLGTNRTKLK